MIYLMRHAESILNVEQRLTCRTYEGDLTAKGRHQAERAAHWFADKGLTQIRTSPFDRARQTAGIVAAALGIAPIIDADLGEANCGDVENMTSDQAIAVWRQVYTRWLLFDADARFPGGESYAEAVERMKRALRQSSAEQSVLLITHSDITHTVIPALCVNAAALQGLAPLVNTGMIVLEHYDSDRYSCSAWNLTEHLNG